MKIIPPRSRLKREISKNIYWSDLIFITIMAILGLIIIFANFNIYLRLGLLIILLIITVFCLIRTGVDRGYNFIFSSIKYALSPKEYNKNSKHNVYFLSAIKDITDNKINYINGEFSKVLKIYPNSFNYLIDIEQDNLVENLSTALKNIKKSSIIALNERVSYRDNINFYETLKNEIEEQFNKNKNTYNTTRLYEIDILLKNLKELSTEESSDIENVPLKKGYYLLLYNVTDEEVDLTRNLLINAGLNTKVLNNKEIAIFSKYCYTDTFFAKIFDDIKEEDYLDLILPERIKFYANKIELDNVKYGVFFIDKFPLFVNNEWLRPLFELNYVRTYFHLNKINDIYAIKQIEKALSICRDKYIEGNNKKSVENKLYDNIEIFDNLLNDLNKGECLIHCDIFLLVEDIGDNIKTVSSILHSYGIFEGRFLYKGEEVIFNIAPSQSNKLARYGIDLPSETLSAGYPFIGNIINDKEGIYLGTDENEQPVLWDKMIHRKNYNSDLDRTSGNVGIFGTTGKGKSHKLKLDLKSWACRNSKIIIFDVEDEYRFLGNLFGASIIDVGGGNENERINPLQIFPKAINDEEDNKKRVEQFNKDISFIYSEKNNSSNIPNFTENALNDNQINSQLIFLQAFHKLAIPEISEDCNTKLINIIADIYKKFNITNETDISKLSANDFPLYCDIYKEVNKRLKISLKEKDDYNIRIYEKLENYLKLFIDNGAYEGLWGRPTTINLNNNIVILSFRNLLSQKNYSVCNAQSYLLFRFMETEIIKNKEYSDRTGKERYLSIVFDEIQKLIDSRLPIAFTAVADIANRVRKYLSSIVLATQNIETFMGTNEEMKKSANAILNALQYKFIFNLEGRNLDHLMELYGSSMNLTDIDYDIIRKLKRGECLFMITNHKRLKIKVSNFPGEEIFTRAL